MLVLHFPHATLSSKRSLKKMPRELVVAGLRALDGDFVTNHSETSNSILLQVAHFPGARDLLEPLAGAPAARFLEKAIQHDEEQRAKRQEWKKVTDARGCRAASNLGEG